MRFRHLFLTLLLTSLVACEPSANSGDVILVPEMYDSLTAAIAAAPDHATIQVNPGSYQEQLTIMRPVNITASAGTVTLIGPAAGAAITIINTQDVTIRGLTIVGGDIGITIQNSSGVTVDENLVQDSRYRGIEVLTGSAEIINNTVRPADEPYVIGIRVANASSWPPSLISDNVVEGANAYGIAVNFAYSTVVDNQVHGGERAGIAINEMSHADVTSNQVSASPRYGILVTDMSHAVLKDNAIAGAIQPIEVQYFSEVELIEN